MPLLKYGRGNGVTSKHSIGVFSMTIHHIPWESEGGKGLPEDHDTYTTQSCADREEGLISPAAVTDPSKMGTMRVAERLRLHAAIGDAFAAFSTTLQTFLTRCRLRQLALGEDDLQVQG